MFTKDDLEVVQTIGARMGLAIQRATQPKAKGIGAGAGADQ
jgi:GAF domain-containing protein